MARQPEYEDGLKLDLSGLPGLPVETGHEPMVGDIYRSQSGQPAFWWVVGITHSEVSHTAFYLVFNVHGELIGTSRAAMHYLRRKSPVGFAPVPMVTPEWIQV